MEEEILNERTELILIGGSAGSLEVIIPILSGLRATGQPPVIIVLHRRAGEDSGLIELLAFKTKIPVKEAEEKEIIRDNTIYVAAPDYHLLIEEDHTFSLDDSEKENYSRPSIDITFQTAAEAYGKNLLCILLSGANADGTEGLIYVKEKGGMVVIQDPASATVSYMPAHALGQVKADYVLHAGKMAEFINNLRDPD